MVKIVLNGGFVLLMLAVILGAFGAHGLKHRLTADLMAVYQTAVQYHFYHGLGILVLALLALQFPQSTGFVWAGFCLIVGILLFSGSLYVLAGTGIRWLGAITPLGGLLFIVGWLTALISGLRLNA